MFKILQLIAALLLIAQSPNLFSQITIGSGLPANSGTLLDLKETEGNSTRGLALPRVALENRSTLTIDDTDTETYIGAVVYNVTRNDDNDVTENNRMCPGIHVWYGDSWQPLIPYPKFTGLSGYAADDLVDIRNDGNDIQTYHTAYFRAFNENVENVRVNSCDPKDMDTSLAIDAGRWMTQSLRTWYTVDGTWLPEKAQQEINAVQSVYRSVKLEERRGAAIRSRSGMLYNWATATNGKGGADGKQNVDNPAATEERDIDPVRRQGICPNGWHLPSFKEYLELFSVLEADPETYCELPAGETTYPTTAIDILLAKDNVYPYDGRVADTKGRSKPADHGGFALELSGYAQYWPGYYTFDWWPGGWVYLWTSSASATPDSAHSIMITHVPDGSRYQMHLDQSQRTRMYGFSVRCKED